MATHEIIIPRLGEGITEVNITKWCKKIGEQINEDDVLVEIATDKVDSEITSPFSGILIKIFYQEGEIAGVDKTLAILEYDGAGEKLEKPIISKIHHQEESQNEERTTSTEIHFNESPSINNTNNTTRYYSPLVKNIAKQENVSISELEKITGSGKDGRITKEDLLQFIKYKSDNINTIEDKLKSKDIETQSNNVISLSGKDEIIEMDRMRKIISDHMIYSKHTSAHVSSFIEVDVTNMVNWRNKVKEEFLKIHGEKLTYTPIFIEAIAKAILKYPFINVSVDGSKIIKRGNINVGMATALPTGNLIVPVIKNAEQLNLLGLSKKVNDLANRARTNKLRPEEIQEGTFTITNLGLFDTDFGTPIINQPQAAILAVGAIKKKPVVIESSDGDFIGIRQMMYLSLSYDHRVIDGALGGYFLKEIADSLRCFDKNRLI